MALEWQVAGQRGHTPCPRSGTGAVRRYPMSKFRSGAVRRYPTSKVRRGAMRRYPMCKVRSGAIRRYPMSKVRSGGREEIPHIQGQRNVSKMVGAEKGQADRNHNHRKLMNLLTWTTALSHSMKL